MLWLSLKRNSSSYQNSEKGIALTEFALALPFLLTLLFGVLDIGSAIRAYLVLQDAVTAGAERAMSAPSLQTGVRDSCNTPSDNSHQAIHKRVSSLLSFQAAQLESPCVISTFTNGDKTVEVQATAVYDGFFPLFDGITLRARIRVPYILS